MHNHSYREEYLRSIGIFRDAVFAILAVIAQQERIRIRERVVAGLDRALAKGKTLGRPRAAVNRANVWALRDAGRSIRDVAALLKLSHGTVQRTLAGR